MATASTGDESIVAVRRISTLLRFLRSDMQAVPEPGSSADLTADGTHFNPVLLPCCLANGGIQEGVLCGTGDLYYKAHFTSTPGVQGFKWYWRELKVDKDGDIADEFFDNISFS